MNNKKNPVANNYETYDDIKLFNKGKRIKVHFFQKATVIRDDTKL